MIGLIKINEESGKTSSAEFTVTLKEMERNTPLF